MSAVPNRMNRRILVLYRIAPEQAERVLPAGYQPRKVRGFALGGIALMRCVGVQSRLIPTRMIACENALHFVSGIRTVQQRAEAGVFVMRYDTSSRLHAWIGGERRWHCRHHHAKFRVIESPESISIRCDSDDRQMHVSMEAREDRAMSQQSIFRSTEQVFHLLRNELQSLGLTPRDSEGLPSSRRVRHSRLIPLSVKRIESSVFDEAGVFPIGSVQFDSAYSLRDDELVWSDEGAVCTDVATA